MKAPEQQLKPKILPPTGMHVARCYQVIDLGTQPNNFDPARPKRLLKLVFEIDKTNDFGHGPQPFTISKEYPFTMAQYENKLSNLRLTINNWRGKSLSDEEAQNFDFTTLLNQFAFVNIVHKTSSSGKERAEIASISPLVNGITKFEPVNHAVCFSLDDFNQSVYERIDKYTQEKIAISPEYKFLNIVPVGNV